ACLPAPHRRRQRHDPSTVCRQTSPDTWPSASPPNSFRGSPFRLLRSLTDPGRQLPLVLFNSRSHIRVRRPLLPTLTTLTELHIRRIRCSSLDLACMTV